MNCARTPRSRGLGFGEVDRLRGDVDPRRLTSCGRRHQRVLSGTAAHVEHSSPQPPFACKGREGCLGLTDVPWGRRLVRGVVVRRDISTTGALVAHDRCSPFGVAGSRTALATPVRGARGGGGPTRAGSSGSAAADRRSCAGGGGDDVAHSSVWPPHGSSPADRRLVAGRRSVRHTFHRNGNVDAPSRNAPIVRDAVERRESSAGEVATPRGGACRRGRGCAARRT